MGSCTPLQTSIRAFQSIALVSVAACFSGSDAPRPDSGIPNPHLDASLPETGVEEASAEAGDDSGLSSGCVPATGAGTQHAGAITTAETWTAAGSPHVLPYDTSVSAAITLEACAVVQIAAAKTITFGPGGSLVANGTAAQPVTIQATSAQAPFASLRFIGGTAHLSYTTVAYGGDPLNSVPDLAATFDVRLNPVLLDHVTVTGSASQGLYLHDGGGFDPASTELVVTGSKGAPVHTWTSAAGGLPSGTYTGNGADEILLSGESCTTEGVTTGTVTLHDRGVPYHVGHSQSAGQLCVSAGTGKPLATLVIEPGLTLRFKKGGNLKIEQFQGTSPASGALVAVGTAQKPIVFTSAEATPAAGDWLGIWFGEVPDASSKIDFASVEYAGGASTSGSDSCAYTATTGAPNDAAIRVFGAPAGGQFVTNTAIVSSAANGIDRGFRSDTKMPDFLATNTFTSVGHCKETYPRDVSGTCPAPAMVPCP
jgi:hypothetical protein